MEALHTETPPAPKGVTCLLGGCKKVGEGKYRFASNVTAHITQMLRRMPEPVQRHELKMLLGAAAFFMHERNADEAGFFVLGVHAEVSAALGLSADEANDAPAPVGTFSFDDIPRVPDTSALLGRERASFAPSAAQAAGARVHSAALRHWAPAAPRTPTLDLDDTNPHAFADCSTATS